MPQQELIPVPDEGEWVRLVPVIGTASSPVVAPAECGRANK